MTIHVLQPLQPVPIRKHQKLTSKRTLEHGMKLGAQPNSKRDRRKTLHVLLHGTPSFQMVSLLEKCESAMGDTT